MKIEKLKTFLKDGKAEFIGTCVDCGVKVCVCASERAGEIFISGGAVYDFHKTLFFKCDGCYKKDPVLRNFSPCEVYSRVVGYLRPVSQWNPGKQAEFQQRKNFTLGMKVLIKGEERELPLVPFFRKGKELSLGGVEYLCVGIETRRNEIFYILEAKNE